MLGCTEERLRQMDTDARGVLRAGVQPVHLRHRQGERAIRGEDDTNMRFGDTLSADKFDGFKFDYCISNPPFGDLWHPQAAEVEKEFKSTGGGRFPVEKLPPRATARCSLCSTASQSSRTTA